ncbi:MAG: transcriptional regulator GcvA [Pseudomonadota bacterium]
MNKLPPLNALKAFEAAARHLSVKAAAEELSVTPGAVSQMLKTLELHLGRKLFDRINRGIVLTEAGRNYLPPVRNAFRQIAEASRRVAAEAESNVLTVSVTPFFASAWLVPRLNSFQAAHPGIDLRIVTSTRLADFTRDGIDVAIRHGLGRYPGLRAEHVLAVAMIPVASPALVARRGMPARVADLLDWPLVQDADRKGWALWFEAQGLAEAAPTRGPSFDDSGLLLGAIIAGQGAGLLPDAMVETDVKEGRLTRLAEPKEIEVFAYYLVYPELAQGRAKIQAFRDWILSISKAP